MYNKHMFTRTILIFVLLLVFVFSAYGNRVRKGGGSGSGGGSGDVSGPGSSTDNAVVRWDSTTGTAIQNSSAIISDAGVLTGLTGITSSGTINFSGLTASRVLQTDGSKNLESSSVTTTELGYLSGVTSAVQTQLTSFSTYYLNDTNLLTNGHFEVDVSGWTLSDGTNTFTRDTVNPLAPSAGDGYWDGSTLSGDTLTSPSYTVTASTKSRRAIAGCALMGFGGSIPSGALRAWDGTAALGADVDISGLSSTGYKYYITSFTVPASGTVAIQLEGGGVSHDIYVDDCFIVVSDREFFSNSVTNTDEGIAVFKTTLGGQIGASTVNITSAKFNASAGFGDGIAVTGSADEVQLTVTGHSTQTSDSFVVENSSNTDVFSITNTGNTFIGGDVTLANGKVNKLKNTSGTALEQCTEWPTQGFTNKTASFSLTTSDHCKAFIDTGGNAITATFPTNTTASNLGLMAWFCKMTDTGNTFTIDAFGTEPLNSIASETLALVEDTGCRRCVLVDTTIGVFCEGGKN